MEILLPRSLQRGVASVSLLASFVCLLWLIFWLSRPSLTSSQKFNALYNWPLYSICYFWLYCRLREHAALKLSNVALDAIAVCIAASRMFGDYLPSSGHALLLSYSPITVANRYYQVIALSGLMITIVMKLQFGDRRSWVYGILAGVTIGLLYRRVDSGRSSE